MEIGNTLNLANGLRLCVDWLSWTFKEPCTPLDAISFMGYSPEDFRQQPKGRNGYRSQLLHCAYDISVQYDGNEGMGVHVDVSGSAIGNMLEHFYRSRIKETAFHSQGYETTDFQGSVVCDLLAGIIKRGQVTRLDLAIDDIGCNFYTMSELHDIFWSHLFSTRSRSWFEHTGHSTEHNDLNEIGWTIYLGKRTSSLMLRIYDKQQEQNIKRLKSCDAPIETPWVRWELEMKKERAQRAAELISQGMSISFLAMGVLGNQLRIIEMDNSRNTRCSTSEKWERFLDGIERLSLYRPKEEKTLNDTKQWLFKQVAPSLATVVLADGGSMEYLEYLLACGSNRLNGHQTRLIGKEMGLAV